MSASLPPHRLQIELERRPTAVILRLDGELDAGTAEQLERCLGRIPHPCPLVVLDLRELSFVDSLGLNMLFRAREWADSRDVALRVVRGPVHVQRLLAISALDGSLGPFYADSAAALRA